MTWNELAAFLVNLTADPSPQRPTGRSRGTAPMRAAALARKGYLKLDAKVARGIRVLNPGGEPHAR